MDSVIHATLVYLQSLKGLAGELWIYFLVGFLMAGVVAEFVPSAALLRFMGKNNVATYLRAMAAGMFASLCSCGAIPIAATMRKRGATRAAALTFMLAAPWAGFTQLAVFYKFLGFTGTAVMFAGAMSVALFSGLILGRLEDRGWLNEPVSRNAEQDGPACAPEKENASRERQPVVSCARLLSVLIEAWNVFRELWTYLVLGLLLAALVKAFLPAEWITRYLGTEAGFNQVFTALPLAVVLELCSEGFSVFAGQLHHMGATLAVVFVMVLVGVTTDFTELSVIWGKFGKRSAVAYLLTATTLTVIFGLIIQKFFG